MITIESDVIGVTNNGPDVITGTAKGPSFAEITLAPPVTISGTYSVTINFESQNRPGYVLSKTLEITSLLEPFYAAEVLTSGSAKIEDDVLVQEYVIENKSNLPDQYQIEIDGDKWDYELSAAETPSMPVASQFTFVVTGTIDSIGVDDTHTVTIKSVNSPTLSRSIVTETELDVDIGLSELLPQTGLPGELVTTTLVLENLGQATDQFEIQLTNGRWSSSLSATETIILRPGESDSIVISVEIGDSGTDQLQLGILSKRSGELLAERTLDSTTYTVYMPWVIR